MDFAPQFVGQVRRRQRRLERGHGARRLGAGQPGIARLHPQIGAARILRGFGFAGRNFIGRGRGIPPFERDISEAKALPRRDAASFLT